MTRLRTEAESLAVSLELGAIKVADVMSWAGKVIECEESPHWSICEVATMGAKYAPDVAAALREVPGKPEPSVVKRLVLKHLANALADDAGRADQIASALFQLAVDDALPDARLRALAWWAWDALSLADQGTIAETRGQIVDEMKSALRLAAAGDGGVGEGH